MTKKGAKGRQKRIKKETYLFFWLPFGSFLAPFCSLFGHFGEGGAKERKWVKRLTVNGGHF
jgi:hypothetical protein